MPGKNETSVGTSNVDGTSTCRDPRATERSLTWTPSGAAMARWVIP